MLGSTAAGANLQPAPADRETPSKNHLYQPQGRAESISVKGIAVNSQGMSRKTSPKLETALHWR
jgi:hypothetical protein